MFNSQIDHDFVHAVQSIAKELKTLNKKLEQKKENETNTETAMKNAYGRLPFGDETIKEHFRDWKEIPVHGNSHYQTVCGSTKIDLYREADNPDGTRNYILMVYVDGRDVLSVKVELNTEHDENLIWHKVEDRYNLEDAKHVAENLCEGTYLADCLTDDDYADIIAHYQDNHSMQEADWNQYEAAIKGIMYDHYFSKRNDNFYVMADVMYVKGKDLSDIDEFYNHLKMNGYTVYRVTDRVFVVDADILCIVESCALDRDPAIFNCHMDLDDCWQAFSPIGFKEKAVQTIFDYVYAINYSKDNPESPDEIKAKAYAELNKCSRESEA